ncbi:MAG TPA: MG2 domain-containing protein [Saprospiraceae bacterium]|nr:MG2 domain-containing protein [Saprospiraceae bacterium]
MRYVARIFTALTLFVFIFNGCKKAGPLQTATDLSALGTYIAGYVPEVIQSQDPVRIRFAKPVVSDSLVGSVVDQKLYSLTPKTDGAAVWEDVYTFSFTPKEKFRPGSSHTLTIHLGNMFADIDPGYHSIHFNFSIRPVQLYVSVDPAGPSEADAAIQVVQGQIRTSEFVNPGDLEQVVQISFGSSKPVPQWLHSENGKAHTFTLSDLRRTQKDEKLTVSWDGKAIDSPSKGSSSVMVPASDVFKVTGVTTIQEGSHEVRLTFSDHLDPDFGLTGMVLVNGSDKGFETRRAKHILSVFPGTEISGDFTLHLDAGIRSSTGKTLGERQSFRLSFEDINPQVELLGKGNIVPHSHEVILPFKAVNLSAVDIEVFEIFESNVMQFLQYSDLWYANGYESVGRVVGSHVIQLNELQSGIVRNQWQRYAIDLSHYTDLHAGSIYEVRIGFRKDYNLYSCTGESASSAEVAPSDPDATLWQYYYDYDGYDYENRENPCMPEYYTADHFVRRNVLASNLGVSAKAGNDNALRVFIHDLRTTEAIAGCNIRIYDFQQQLITEGKTNNEGLCELKGDREPAFVLADFSGEKGYLKVTDGNALSVSDFDVEGTASHDGIKGFIYCERDVWRPGDTIFLNFILQTEETGASDHPVTCVVYNPRGQKRYDQTKNVHVGHIYSFPIPTDVADLTGNWRTELQIGGVKFNKSLKVETIKPNRLKITVDRDGPIDAWKKETIIPLNVQWLHGSPAGGLEAKVELGLSPVTTAFKGFSQYRFDDPARKVDATVTTVFDGPLDASGNAHIILTHDAEQLLPGKMMANLKTRVFEKGGDFSTDQFSAEWWPYQAYAGLSIPNNRWGYKQLEEGADNTIGLVSLDRNGKGLSERELSVGVYQADWSWWWNDNRYELAQYNSAQHLGALSQTSVITNDEGRAEFMFKPLDYGLYLIRVCDTKSGHCSGDYAYSGYFYGEEEGRNAIAKLTLTANKAVYATGDNVLLSIPSAPGSLVMVSIENDHTVLSTHQLKATAEVTTFSFTASKEMAPNVYAHVRLIQPHSLGDNDMPLRMYGVIPVMIEDPTSRLQPVISMPDVLKPDGMFEISVSEQNNQGMAYTIAVVDEGLLDLTRFKTPDPWNHFYAKEALGVRTWDVYDYVLGALGGPVERILAIGGDGSGVQIQAVNEVNRFKPVVIHLGPFILKPGNKATHKIQMPNYVGSVRSMVVAVSNHQYGFAEKAAPVKSPVMILATMPRVLAPGEQIAIPINVFAMDEKIRNVEVSIRGNDKVSIDGATRKTVSFNKQGDQLMTFTADIAHQIGKGEVWIEATAGDEKATQHIEISVRNPNPYLSEVTEVLLEKGKSWESQIVNLGMPGTNEAVLEISSLFPANLDARLNYVIQYPYGCLEQTTSAAFPQLFVDRLIELGPEESVRLQHNVRSAITKISRYVNPSGGFSYWPGENDVNEWTNSYTGHFLIEAQRAGYFVDAKLIDHWKTFQSSRAQQFSTKDQESGNILNQAYRLYTLALAGNPELGAMNRLRNVTKLSGTARYMLAACYANSGQSAIAKELITSPATVEEYQLAGMTYGSATRDRALIVEALVSIGAHDQALPIVKRIADERGSAVWYSTQSTAYALIAMAKFASLQQDKDLYFAYRAAGNEKQTVRQKKTIFQQKITEGKPKSVFVENLSESPLYVRLIRRGRPLEPPSTSVQNHLALKVSYQDMQGKTIDPIRLNQGTDFVMSVTIANPATYAGDLDEVALQSIFPSGWEIINQRMDNLGERFKNSESDYQDIRDDRVYTFFDLYGKTSKTYRVMLNAAYPGKYILPPTYCEAMYDHAVNATITGRWVEVVTDHLKIAKAGVTGGE